MQSTTPLNLLVSCSPISLSFSSPPASLPLMLMPSLAGGDRRRSFSSVPSNVIIVVVFIVAAAVLLPDSRPCSIPPLSMVALHLPSPTLHRNW
ncbi:hypothetical protein SOVF_003840 [Spinacia oleracea]|nr:hypothetical protein SOVF_003840 [Spinacia oleracea]